MDKAAISGVASTAVSNGNTVITKSSGHTLTFYGDQTLHGISINADARCGANSLASSYPNKADP